MEKSPIKKKEKSIISGEFESTNLLEKGEKNCQGNPGSYRRDIEVFW